MGEILTIIGIAVLLGVIFFAWWRSWKARQRRQAALVPPTAPAGLSPARSEHRVLYLATTAADQPLERIAVAGLGFRAETVLGIHEEGIVLSLAGRRDPLFIPAERIVGGGRANWTIDRASGGDRIVFLRWRITEGADPVDTNLRAVDTDAVIAALQPLLPVPTGTTPKVTP